MRALNSTVILTVIGFIPLLQFSKSAIISMPVSQTLDQVFNYTEALDKSLLFYEAQRSGKLPPDNRIPWRGDSALQDRGNNGEDLTGGYYDGTDYVKFLGLQAATSTLLAWGIIEGSEGYKNANLLQRGLECLKWFTDFLIKCHVSPNELYGQVGDFTIDQKYWGRPEDMNMSRPAYKIDSEHPGSDLAGETAAALASASIVFKNNGLNEYSELCLKHALELFKFGSTYRGEFHHSLQNSAIYYTSSGYKDELAWAAAWLHRATDDDNYLKAAQLYESELQSSHLNFTFGHRIIGVQLLLAQITGLDYYKSAIVSFCDYQMENQTRTPGGLIFIDREGVLSHAANIAFLCMQANKFTNDKYKSFAKHQIDYILGKSGRSFVVGYGNNSPQQPFHAASSCPDRPQSCGWDEFRKNSSSPQILYGALVSGPDVNDAFLDRREAYIYTDVNIEFNSGFQSTLALFIEPNYYSKSLPRIEIISNVKVEEHPKSFVLKL